MTARYVAVSTSWAVIDRRYSSACQEGPTVFPQSIFVTTVDARAERSVSGGRREINWDGGGDAANATMFPTPMTTLNSGLTTRGVVFTTETGFEISGQPTPEFGEIDISYPGIFTTFSAPRLFTPHASTITDVHFYLPGTGTPAVVNAFGAVFTDVDLPQSTSIEYFDKAGNSLGRAFVPPASNGLSFVGLVFHDRRIGRLRITSGNASLFSTIADGGRIDVVVMDDFIYGEPSVDRETPEPPPFNPPPVDENPWDYDSPAAK